jgi:hypothetical protein
MPALMSIPRTIWGNIINFFAIVRASYQYVINKAKKQTLAWDKTVHDIPANVAETHASKPKNNPGKVNDMTHLAKLLPKKNFVRLFTRRLEEGDEREKVEIIESIPQSYGKDLFPYFIRYITDPSWEVRAAVCRSLSFLRLYQAIPYLKSAVCDQDWVVRGNAVRALGKLSDQGEKALMSLLDSAANFARDAARTILEQQGFFDRYLAQLNDPDFRKANRARIFFTALAYSGKSELAQEIIKQNHLKRELPDQTMHPAIPGHHEDLIQPIHSMDA